MRKLLWKLGALALLLLTALCVLIGCDSVIKKNFEKSGLTITLTSDFVEKEHVEYTAYYVSEKMIVVTLKETFDSLAVAKLDDGDLPETYARTVKSLYKNFYNSATEVVSENGLVYFTYENDVFGKDFKYLYCAYKSVDSFWSVQFGCANSNFDKLKPDMIKYAKTVKVESFVEELFFQKIPDKDEYRVRGIGTFQAAEIVIPAEYDGMPVTEIYDGAFRDKSSITSVTLPESIRSIGYMAFSGCTKLQQINLPDNVESIGYQAFQSCRSLTQIDLPDALSALGYGAFNGCSKLQSVVIPDGVTALKYDLFKNCSALTGVTLHNRITAIDSGVFQGCKALKTLALPTDLTQIGGSAFENCIALTGLAIPDGVTSIGAGAFSGCIELTELTLPVGVAAIPDELFLTCTKLESVTALGSVVSVGEKAFKGCSSLTGFALPATVTSVSREAFSGCSALKQLDLANLTAFGEYAFMNCLSLQNVTLSQGVTEIPNGAFSSCAALTEMNLENVTKIGLGAFQGCSSLRQITLPQAVTALPSGAFSGCSALTDINLEHLTELGDSVFKDCASLASVTLPAGITGIQSNTFENCKKLTQVSLPATLTEIGNYAFKNCSELTEIVIPFGVDFIGFHVFEGCDKLTVYCEAGDGFGSYGWLSDWNGPIVLGYNNVTTNADYDYFVLEDGIALTKYKGGANAVVPATLDGYRVLGFDRVFFKNETIVSVDLQIPMEFVGSIAFYQCPNLEIAKLADGVTALNENIFCECEKLSALILPKSVTSVLYNSIYMCKALTKVYYGGSMLDWDVVDVQNGSPVANATVYYYTENQPSVEGYYWYYKDGVVTEW